MANLPDVDTTTTSWIAYWNAIDDGDVQEIAPENALSDSNLQEYTLYDNGWEGKYQDSHRTFTVRMKTDGWVVAYLDRTSNFITQEATSDKSSINGEFDILQGWSGGLTQNTLERAISSLVSSLGNANINYTSTEVGLYNYSHPSQKATVMWESISGEGGGDASYLYTNATMNYGAFMGVAQGARSTHYDYGPASANVDFEGTTVASQSGSTAIGTVDLLNGYSATETEYVTNYSTNEPSYAETPSAQVSVLICWTPN